MEFQIEWETFELRIDKDLSYLGLKLHVDGQKQPATGFLQKSCSESLSKFHTETHDVGFFLVKFQGNSQFYRVTTPSQVYSVNSDNFFQSSFMLLDIMNTKFFVRLEKWSWSTAVGTISLARIFEIQLQNVKYIKAFIMTSREASTSYHLKRSSETKAMSKTPSVFNMKIWLTNSLQWFRS